MKYFCQTAEVLQKKKLKTIIDSKLKGFLANSKDSLGYPVDFDFKIFFSEVFHEKQGFDVVIANPPWGSTLSKQEKAILKDYDSAIDSSTPNSFAYFIGLAYRIYKGNLAYILPDSILIKDYAKTRKLLKRNIANIDWYQNVGVPDDLKPFLMVDHDVCVIITTSSPSNCVSCSTTMYNSKTGSFATNYWQALKDDIINSDFDYVFNLLIDHKNISILHKIQSHPPTSSYLQCHEGIHTGNARDVLFKQNKENKYCMPLYYGGKAGDSIQNYHSWRSGWFVDYRNVIIDKSKGFYASLRDERIFKFPKIYITRTGNPFKAFLDYSNYASNNFFSLQLLDYSTNTMDELMVILPFIISRVAQYFIRTFAAPRLGNIFVETKIVHLMKLGIPKLSTKDRESIKSEVGKIVELMETSDYLSNLKRAGQSPRVRTRNRPACL